MEYPHAKREAREYGYSPGNGMSPVRLSRDPLASEEEVAASMDTESIERPEPAKPSLDFMRLATDPPTKGDDPYLFDDVGDDLGDALPRFSLDIGDGPLF